MIQLADRDTWICRVCSGKKVLHLGCVDAPLLEEKARTGRLLHDKLLKVASRVVGVDLDATGIAELERLYPGQKFVVANAESFATKVKADEYDIILAADIIEHVSNPGLLLDSAASLMCPRSRLVITTPSAFSAKKFFCAFLTGYEHNHPEHTFFYSPMTLSRLATLHGLEIEQMHSFQWRHPTWKNYFINLIAQPIVRFSQNLTADEIAVVLSRKPSSP
jgi:2-polyprenyl-3-methyl-5-hydroxy-6-metoxy-1,4-benzoquinol methylase